MRAFLAWRQRQPALQAGTIRFLDTPEPVLAFVREHAGQRLLVAFNLSGSSTEVVLDTTTATPVALPGFDHGSLENGRLRLPGYGVLYAPDPTPGLASR